MTHEDKNKIVLYTLPSGGITIDALVEDDSIWLNQDQISKIFDVWKAAISKHFKNIFASWELEKEWVVSKMETTAWDGKTYKTNFYNLDAIISVWYRVNSKDATQFRKRATSTLKDHLTTWFTINQKRLEQTWLDGLKQSFEMMKRAIESKALNDDETQGMLDLIMAYLPGFLTMNKYDQRSLEWIWETNEEQYQLQRIDAVVALANLKAQLIAKWEATNLFAHPKSDGGLDACFWAIYQTDSGVDLYPSVEEKAAMLLYLIIKNHPFTDGNKRSAAYLFIWYLKKNNLLEDATGNQKITHQTMVALALLIATSDPNEKEAMIWLVVALLK
jgi:prophage maintenance system killer protein